MLGPELQLPLCCYLAFSKLLDLSEFNLILCNMIYGINKDYLTGLKEKMHVSTMKVSFPPSLFPNICSFYPKKHR